MGFGRQTHGFALRLPQVRHHGREAKAALVTVENSAFASVFKAMQTSKRLLDVLLFLLGQTAFSGTRLARRKVNPSRLRHRFTVSQETCSSFF